MCGIVGFIDFNKKLSVDQLNKFIQSLSHRGPDDNGDFFLKIPKCNIAIGHTRLTILDPSIKGKQPMTYKDIVISFNGEIYNFMSIRDDLEKKGYVFETKTDTEVLLKAYDCWGLKFINKVNGMFAISLFDKPQRKLYLLRDRLGVKPLYWSFSDDNFIFSSEIKVFKNDSSKKVKISNTGIYNYFKYGYIPEPHSILEGVQKLKAGYFLELDIDKKNISLEKYWDVEFTKDNFEKNFNEEDVIKKLDKMINESVKLRMVSDFPVGIFLSGGYDSSLIASYMCNLSNKNIESFTIGFENELVDESMHAKKISNFLKTNHHEFILKNEDILDILWNYKELYDEPIGDPAILPTAFLSRQTKKKVKVVQSADGGDELFSGYDKYRKILNRNEKSKYIPVFIKKTLIEFYFKRQNSIRNKNLLNIYKYCKHRDLISWFIDDSLAHDNLQLERLLINPKITKTNFQLNLKNKNDLNQMLYLDVKTFLVDGIMHKVDRASMYSGLEAREPLLDYKLVEYALSLPEHLKMKGGELKYLLKTLAHSKIPKELIERPKQGFNIPIVEFTLIIFKEHKNTLLNKATISEQNIFNYNEIENLKNEIENHKYNRIRTVWLLIIFQIWYYNFFED